MICARPCYNGKPWNDHAMAKWFKYEVHLPAFIYTFVNLRGLPKGNLFASFQLGKSI